MTRRPARRRGRAPGVTLDAEAYPALRAFARGYLHEDMTAAHGSAAGAALAFAADAQPAERDALVEDLDRFAAAAAPMAWTDVARAIHTDLGSAWVPAALDDLRMLAAVLRQRG